MFALEMVQENKVAAGFADALHFVDDADGIGDGGHEVGGEDAVKTGVGEIEGGGVHLAKLDALEFELGGAFAGLVEHFLGEVDAD